MVRAENLPQDGNLELAYGIDITQRPPKTLFGVRFNDRAQCAFNALTDGFNCHGEFNVLVCVVLVRTCKHSYLFAFVSLRSFGTFISERNDCSSPARMSAAIASPVSHRKSVSLSVRLLGGFIVAFSLVLLIHFPSLAFDACRVFAIGVDVVRKCWREIHAFCWCLMSDTRNSR